MHLQDYLSMAEDNEELLEQNEFFILRTARIVYEDLSYVFSHFDEVITMLKYANDMLYLYEHYLR